MDGLNLITLVKYVAVLVAAMIIGNWFLIEVKKAKFNRATVVQTLYLRSGSNYPSGGPGPAAIFFAVRKITAVIFETLCLIYREIVCNPIDNFLY